MVKFSEGYTLPDTDRVQPPNVTLSDEELAYVAEQDEQSAIKYLRARGIDLFVQTLDKGFNEHDIQGGLLDLHSVNLNSRDGKPVSVWLQVGIGYNDARDYFSAAATLQRLRGEYSEFGEDLAALFAKRSKVKGEN